MQYRNLGKCGLKVSEISLGSWLTYGTATEAENARRCVRKAYDIGINYFDCADAYGYRPGAAEELLGGTLSEFERSSFVLATKVFFPVGSGPNDRGLSRKHIMEQVDKSLKRLQTDYIDIYFCHRYDDSTPLDETLRAMDDLVRQGKVLYYGISEWTPLQISEGVHTARQLGLHPITVNQPRYSMLERNIEQGVMQACAGHGLGMVGFSPLAQGVLSGKYRQGQPLPENSRAADERVNKFMQRFMNEHTLDKVASLQEMARGLGLTMSQLALAWILQKKEISSVIIGASNPGQIEENSAASGIVLNGEVMCKIEEVLTA